jgi:hypothetical protein
VRGCVFPLYPDGNQPMEWVVELAQEDQLPLIEALRADPDVFEANTSERSRSPTTSPTTVATLSWCRTSS